MHEFEQPSTVVFLELCIYLFIYLLTGHRFFLNYFGIKKTQTITATAVCSFLIIPSGHVTEVPITRLRFMKSQN